MTPDKYGGFLHVNAIADRALLVMVYDVNGQSNPNTLTKDIRTYGEVTIKNKLIPELPQVAGYEFEWSDDNYTNFRTTDWHWYCSLTGNDSYFYCNSGGTNALRCYKTNDIWQCSIMSAGGN